MTVDRGEPGIERGSVTPPLLVPANWDRLVGGGLYRYKVAEGGKWVEEEGWLSSYVVNGERVDACFTVDEKRLVRRFAFRDRDSRKDAQIWEVRKA